MAIPEFPALWARNIRCQYRRYQKGQKRSLTPECFLELKNLGFDEALVSHTHAYQEAMETTLGEMMETTLSEMIVIESQDEGDGCDDDTEEALQ